MKPSIHNTLSRRKEELAPSGEFFGMYCCGPTVYGPAHIGNFRTFLAQDVLRRVLECSGMKVRHVRNITDVDDKTIRESRKLGISLSEFTKKWTDKFHADCEKLNMLPPSVEPRATEHIAEQLEMVSKLVENGHAYAAGDGSVYFKISSDPDYGKLSGLDRRSLATQSVNSAGEANLADEYERESVSDFALWKGRKEEDGDNFWKSPWGEGRPGWHIECSAMSTKYLGPTFDLHGGGVDLCFPHHENEIAQSECSTGLKPYVKYWFHSAHLMVEGAKMSKSLGNLYTLDDLISKGYSAQQIRYALIAGHYRQQLNFTFKGLDDAKSALSKLAKALVSALEKAGIAEDGFKKLIKPEAKIEGTVFGGAWEALCDDVNVPKALGEIFAALPTLGDSKENLEAFGAVLYALGLDPLAGGAAEAEGKEKAPAEIAELARQRWEAKKARNFALADELRGKISALGWTVLDAKDGFSLKKA
ncbi:MAG: cysteine--tRNA ligase [Opitutales bacterium]|jgi:cysteinyl-tRNA synthetase|nr:cysteine--tRNA ligase [Opitutales bacterium]